MYRSSRIQVSVPKQESRVISGKLPAVDATGFVGKPATPNIPIRVMQLFRSKVDLSTEDQMLPSTSREIFRSLAGLSPTKSFEHLNYAELRDDILLPRIEEIIDLAKANGQQTVEIPGYMETVFCYFMASYCMNTILSNEQSNLYRPSWVSKDTKDEYGRDIAWKIERGLTTQTATIEDIFGQVELGVGFFETPDRYDLVKTTIELYLIDIAQPMISKQIDWLREKIMSGWSNWYRFFYGGAFDHWTHNGYVEIGQILRSGEDLEAGHAQYLQNQKSNGSYKYLMQDNYDPYYAIKKLDEFFANYAPVFSETTYLVRGVAPTYDNFFLQFGKSVQEKSFISSTYYYSVSSGSFGNASFQPGRLTSIEQRLGADKIAQQKQTKTWQYFDEHGSHACCTLILRIEKGTPFIPVQHESRAEGELLLPRNYYFTILDGFAYSPNGNTIYFADFTSKPIM